MRRTVTHRRPNHGGSAFRVVVLVLIVALGSYLAWFGVTRIRELNRQLTASEQQANELNQRLQESSTKLDQAETAAKAAQQRAVEAEAKAGLANESRRQAEQAAAQTADEKEQALAAKEQALAAKQQALEEASRAQAESEQAQADLERIRERREKELNRMREALNRVAPTVRTPSGMVTTLGSESFRFAFDSAALRPKNKEILSRIAGILLASEGYRLFIDGHTDDIGTDAYNMDLSKRRAESVREYLVGAGVPADVITIHGFGKSEPLDKAHTPEARAKNRRVEIGIVDTIIHYGEKVSN